MTITPVPRIAVGQNAHSASVLNQRIDPILSGSGYLADGTDFAGFARYTYLNALNYSNGVTINTGVNDATTALQSLLDAMGTLYPKGATAVIPPGDYKITAPLIPPGSSAFMNSSKHRIIMHGARIFSYDATAGRAAFDLSSFINTEGSLTIEGGTIDGANASATTNGVAIHSPNVKFDQTVIRNFVGGYGVTFVNDLAAPPICCEFESCHIQNNRIGMNVTVPASLLYVHGGRIEHNLEEGFYGDSCGKISLIGVTIENNGDGTPSKANLYLKNAVDGGIHLCYFESNAGQTHTSVMFEGIAFSPKGLSFIGNRVVNGYSLGEASSIGVDVGVGAGAIGGVVAHSNFFSGQTSAYRLGTNARGCALGPDYFDDNFQVGAAWSAVTAYVVGNVVSSGGISYICKLANTNQAPPNATYWSVSSRYDISAAATLASLAYDINRFASAIYGGGSVWQALKATSVEVTAGTAAAARLVKHATLGVTLGAAAGATHDFSLLTSALAAIMQVPTGTVDQVAGGHVKAGVAGKGFFVKEGANARMGVSTLVAGTVVVSTTQVAANSRIFLTTNTPGGTPGWLQVSARVNGTSFTILSSNAADTSAVAWEIKEPA